MKIDGTPFPDGSNDLTDLAALEKARTSRRILLGKIHDAEPVDLTPVMGNYLSAKAVAFAAMVEAAKRSHPNERLPVGFYRTASKSFKLNAPSDEPVWTFVAKSASGKRRAVLKYGLLHRTAQLILADALRLRFTPKHYQYDAPGRGIGKAIQRARKLLEDGYVYCVRLDIKDFFGSFSHQGLKGMLPFSESVVKNFVFGSSLNIQIANGTEVQSDKVLIGNYVTLINQQGLPQGSALSPSIGAFAVASAKIPTLQGAVLLNYVDDFLVLAKDAVSLKKAADAVCESVETMPFGNFKLLEKSGSLIANGVTFLGHWLLVENGKVQVKVSPANIQEMGNRVMASYEALSAAIAAVPTPNLKLVSEIYELVKRIEGWRSAFAEADDAKGWYDDWRALAMALCEDAGLTYSGILVEAAQSFAEDAAIYDS